MLTFAVHLAVLPGAEIPYEANIPFIPKGTVGTVSVREGEGTHVFALADGDGPTEVDLLVHGDKHGTFSPSSFPHYKVRWLMTG